MNDPVSMSTSGRFQSARGNQFGIGRGRRRNSVRLGGRRTGAEARPAPTARAASATR